MKRKIIMSQHVNYEKCGFVIGGFDFLVYKGLDKTSDEVAIYWYIHFK